MSSKAFGSTVGQKAHLLRAGGLAAEVADLRADVEQAFQSVESRSGYPAISKMPTAGAGVSLAALPLAKTLTGLHLLQGAVAATLVTPGNSGASLTLTACRPGTGGDAITLQIATGSGLAVSVSGDAITVTLASSGSTVSAIASAINSDASAKLLVHATSANGTGDNKITAALAATHLAGGVGTDLSVQINGVEQQVVGACSDTSIPLVISDLTGYANTDLATLQVACNGRQANSVTFEVVT